MIWFEIKSNHVKNNNLIWFQIKSFWTIWFESKSLLKWFVHTLRLIWYLAQLLVLSMGWDISIFRKLKNSLHRPVCVEAAASRSMVGAGWARAFLRAHVHATTSESHCACSAALLCTNQRNRHGPQANKSIAYKQLAKSRKTSMTALGNSRLSNKCLFSFLTYLDFKVRSTRSRP